MRAGRGIVIATTMGALLLHPVAARADGGAFIEFNRTHYLPGETATGETYVYLEGPHQGLLDRGPFYPKPHLGSAKNIRLPKGYQETRTKTVIPRLLRKRKASSSVWSSPK